MVERERLDALLSEIELGSEANSQDRCHNVRDEIAGIRDELDEKPHLDPVHKAAHAVRYARLSVLYACEPSPW